MQIINTHSNRSIDNELIIPNFKICLMILLLMTFGIIFNETGLNLWVAEYIADGIDGFSLQNHWITSLVLHKYANRVTSLIALILIVFNLIQWIRPTQPKKCIYSGRLLMWSWLFSAMTIAYLKSNTTLACPWDLTNFGGNREYLSLVYAFSESYPIGHCFPSGHASGGYGLIGLGFIALVYRKSFLVGLVPGFVIGLVYGGTQILRGAHFISHDLFTFAICLSFAWIWAHYYFVYKLNKEI